jgi:hypothetical protein
LVHDKDWQHPIDKSGAAPCEKDYARAQKAGKSIIIIFGIFGLLGRQRLSAITHSTASAGARRRFDGANKYGSIGRINQRRCESTRIGAHVNLCDDRRWAA